MLAALFAVALATAAPQEIEVWFLTSPTAGAHITKKSILVAQACERVGDFCFDPKKGLYPVPGGGAGEAPQDEAPLLKFNSDLPQIPSATSVDRSMIDCEKGYLFDMFCGEAKPVDAVAVAPSARTGLEIWMDTSSSLREMDPVDGQGHCHREAFLLELQKTCPFPGKSTVKMYDTSIRAMSSARDACQSQGLNDSKSLMEWIERSQAKKLVIITDASEYMKDFADYLLSKHAHLRGDTGSFIAKQLPALAAGVAQACRM